MCACISTASEDHLAPGLPGNRVNTGWSLIPAGAFTPFNSHLSARPPDSSAMLGLAPLSAAASVRALDEAGAAGLPLTGGEAGARPHQPKNTRVFYAYMQKTP